MIFLRPKESDEEAQHFPRWLRKNVGSRSCPTRNRTMQFVPSVLAYPSYLDCGRPLTVGHTIMNRAAQPSNGMAAAAFAGCANPLQKLHLSLACRLAAFRSMRLAVLTRWCAHACVCRKQCGGTVAPGETLTVSVPSQYQYVLELSGTTFTSPTPSAGRPSCGGTRINGGSGTLTAPSSGTISIKAAHGGMQVYITATCTLTVQGAEPEPEPEPHSHHPHAPHSHHPHHPHSPHSHHPHHPHTPHSHTPHEHLLSIENLP